MMPVYREGRSGLASFYGVDAMVIRFVVRGTPAKNNERIAIVRA